MANKDKFGLPPEKTKQMLADMQNAAGQFENLVSSGEFKDLTSGALEEVKNQMINSNVMQNLATRVAESNSPFSKTESGATLESEAVHLLSSADVILNEEYMKKIPLMKPDEDVDSAIKGMQIVSDNLTKSINKALSSQGSYIDAVSRPPTDLDGLVSSASDMMAGYQKIINNKMMEFNTQTLQSELSKTVGQLPMAERFKFGDLSQMMGADILKGYNGITNKGAGLLKSILTKALTKGSGSTSLKGLVEKAQQQASIPIPPSRVDVNPNGTVTISPGITTVTYPKVPMCAAEEFVGEMISLHKEDIQNMNNNILNNLNSYIGDVRDQLGELDQKTKPRWRDATGEGGVISITDEEAWDYVRGGSAYITQNNVGTAFTGNVRPGITTTGSGTGSGLTVDITVTFGGASSDHVTITSGGTGYSDASNVSTTSSGNGSGCTVDTTTIGGAVSAISINSAGSGYKDGEVLTVAGGSAGTFTLDKVSGAIDGGGIVVNQRGSGYLVGDLLYVIGGNNDATFTVVQINDPGDVPPDKQGNDGKGASLKDKLSMLGGIQSSLASALNFKNIVSNVFPFELPATPAMTDLYNFGTGGSSLPDSQIPSPKGIADVAMNKVSDIVPDSAKPFVGPLKDAADVIIKND